MWCREFGGGAGFSFVVACRSPSALELAVAALIEVLKG